MSVAAIGRIDSDAVTIGDCSPRSVCAKKSQIP